MLSIFICEDDEKQRARLEDAIKKFVFMEEMDMEIVLSTGNPNDVLNYLKENSGTTGLYFLDIDLGHEMTGIILGSKIRELDVLGKIVFVTTHGEMSLLTFAHKIEAMDFIIKDKPDEIARRVTECIKVAYKRHLNDVNLDKKMYGVKIGESVTMVDYDEIMFIEASDIPHRLLLHMDNAQMDYYGTLKEVQQAIPEFYRCHKSVVVNPKNIKEINKQTKEAEMVNGEYCLVSARAMKGLLKLLDSH